VNLISQWIWLGLDACGFPDPFQAANAQDIILIKAVKDAECVDIHGAGWSYNLSTGQCPSRIDLLV
jgi:hypothetical protein